MALNRRAGGGGALKARLKCGITGPTFSVNITEMGMGHFNATSPTKCNKCRNGAMALPRDAISPSRDGYCLLSLTPPRRTRIRGEYSCMAEWNSKEAHPEDVGRVQ